MTPASSIPLHAIPNLSDRDARQRAIVPPERLAACHAVVIGVGAVGRQAALQLAAVGVSRMTLIDHDTVEVANLAPQAYWPADLGRPKVDATADREGGVLVVDAIHEDGDWSAARRGRVDAELDALGEWLGLEVVRSS